MSSTQNGTIYWSTPWTPVNDANFQAALANPQSYQAYLQELRYLGSVIPQLPEDGWTRTTNTDTLVVLMQNDEVGTYTVSASPTTDPLPEEAQRRGITLDPGNDYYIINWSFTGAASQVMHTTLLWLGVAAGGFATISAVATAVATFGSTLLGLISKSVSALTGNAVADAANPAVVANAAEAGEDVGISFSAGVSAVAGAAGAVVGLTVLIIDLLKQDFELRIQVVNRSSQHFLIVPDYYMDHATITAAANSVAYLSGQPELVGPEALPPTICSDGKTWPYSPPVQTYKSEIGPQASEYTLAYQNDGLNAPSVLLQLVDCTYEPPQEGQSYGTLSPSAWNTGWTGVVVNTHYHTDDAPNIAMFTAGADLQQAEKWYDQYDDVTPASTGTFSMQSATLGWVLSADSPSPDPSAGDAVCWWLLITIDD